LNWGRRLLESPGAGNIFVADWGNNAIRRISTSGVVTTVVGAAAPVMMLSCACYTQMSDNRYYVNLTDGDAMGLGACDAKQPHG